jgi:hypothetical protein
MDMSDVHIYQSPPGDFWRDKKKVTFREAWGRVDAKGKRIPGVAVAANLTLEFGDFRFENFESNANNDCVLTFVRAPGATWTKPNI